MFRNPEEFRGLSPSEMLAKMMEDATGRRPDYSGPLSERDEQASHDKKKTD